VEALRLFYITRIIFLVIFLFLTSIVIAQSDSFEGYTLFNPNGSKTTYLINMDGETAHIWNNNEGGGYSVYLLENGNILRPAQVSGAQLQGGASAGLVQEIEWDGTVAWEFEYSSSTYLAHHDIEPMPNGNVLIIAWEVKSATEATAAGRSQSSEVWPDHIIEVEPVGSNGGNIVWEWHAWDHLIQDYDANKANYGIVADHSELLDINLNLSDGRPGGGGDWLHINGISYNPELDQIVISSHYLDEIYVIDHSTTTEEASGHSGGNAGKGGDILYRWGSPSNYGAPGDQYFDVVHCSYWIPSGLPGAGNIMAFNNGEGQHQSEVIEIVPPNDGNGNYSYTAGSNYEPSSPIWAYSESSSFYSNHLGGCQRLSNGNTLISESTSGYLFEVTSEGEKVWEYQHSDEIARSLRYGFDYPGLFALNATNVAIPENVPTKFSIQNYPNPFNPSTTIKYELPVNGEVDLSVYNLLGQKVITLVNEWKSAGSFQVVWDGVNSFGRKVSSGVYHYRLQLNQQIKTGQMILIR